ncbi:hypothetical protein GCM10011578_079560 [Streptomyces fuscichromogenes]|uniref:Uncharacterized protein n=1 Tax=Streptomyces fuscichromogenes TaxID=1324013 RepID=A0A917XKW7_9ACTN|nr:hypothetical protein GCM10011578_079560 [Streptomyces fuscichromogenes]
MTYGILAEARTGRTGGARWLTVRRVGLRTAWSAGPPHGHTGPPHGRTRRARAPAYARAAALSAYEEKLLAPAERSAADSVRRGELLFRADSPQDLVDMFTGGLPEVSGPAPSA